LLGGLGGFQNGFAERGYPARFRAPFVQFPDRSDSLIHGYFPATKMTVPKWPCGIPRVLLPSC
jgi:hypothetical protein